MARQAGTQPGDARKSKKEVLVAQRNKIGDTVASQASSSASDCAILVGDAMWRFTSFLPS